MHQLVTLASIVEKEAIISEERSLIAGVFLNRLRKKMPLGACPTVKYALGKPRKPFLTYADTMVESSYNTYLHEGLPPSPIASPGLACFRAVLKPKTTKYLYFISLGDGSHHFSLNLAEHNLYRRKLGYD